MSAEQDQSRGPFAVETDKVSKHFGAVRAVDELSLSIPKKGITSIVGPNGSGKSTLINLLSGTLPLDGGMVIIDGTGLRVVKAHESPRPGRHQDVSRGAAVRPDQRVGQHHGGADQAAAAVGAGGAVEACV